MMQSDCSGDPQKDVRDDFRKAELRHIPIPGAEEASAENDPPIFLRFGGLDETQIVMTDIDADRGTSADFLNFKGGLAALGFGS